MNGRGRLLALAALPAALLVARVLVARRVRRFETLEPEAGAAPGGFFYLRGRRIHLTVQGSGPPVLLLHGFGASAYAFRHLLPLLRGHYTLIAPDLPGFGYSERDPKADHRYEAQAALLFDLLDRLGVEHAAVVGHSIGAAIALRMAALHPERVSALVLASGPGSSAPEFPRITRPLFALLLPLLVQSRTGVAWGLRAAMRKGSYVDAGAVEVYLDAGRVRGNIATLLAILTGTRHGPAPPPATIRQPVLVLSGEDDRYLEPGRAKLLAGGLADARLAIIDGAAHLPFEEQPAVAGAAVGEFLDAVRERMAARSAPVSARAGDGEDAAT